MLILAYLSLVSLVGLGAFWIYSKYSTQNIIKNLIDDFNNKQINLTNNVAKVIEALQKEVVANKNDSDKKLQDTIDSINKNLADFNTRLSSSDSLKTVMAGRMPLPPQMPQR